MLNSIYKAVEKYKYDSDFIDLTDSNFARPEFYNASYPVLNESIKYALKKRSYNPDPKGDINARIEIASYYQKRGIYLTPEEILLTASTSEGYNIIFQTFGQVGENALIPCPGYPLFEYIFKFNHLKTIPYILDSNNDWRIDLDDLKLKITKSTKFLLLITPNNPTGSVTLQEDLNKITQLCQQNEIILVIDEVFISNSDYIYKLPDRETIKTPILILNGISKMFGLPDFKLGWICIYTKSSDIFSDLLETTNDVYLSANNLSQKILPKLFEHMYFIQKPINELILINRKIVNDFFLNNSQLFKSTYLKGGIHVFVQINTSYFKWRDDENFVLDLLKAKKVLVHPGFFYDYTRSKNYFSFSYILPTKKLRLALNNIKSFLTNFAH